MKYVVSLLVLLFLSCKDQPSKPDANALTNSNSERLDGLTIVDYDGLKPYLHIDDEKLHVVNFWATWCAPCVKELPYFEALSNIYGSDSIDVLLVSLDFPNKYETNLLPFIEKNKLKSTVIALDDTDQNRWIPAINENWSGAIPATLIYKGEKRKFYEQSFTEEELNKEIEQFLNK